MLFLMTGFHQELKLLLQLWHLGIASFCMVVNANAISAIWHADSMSTNSRVHLTIVTYVPSNLHYIVYLYLHQYYTIVLHLDSCSVFWCIAFSDMGHCLVCYVLHRMVCNTLIVLCFVTLSAADLC